MNNYDFVTHINLPGEMLQIVSISECVARCNRLTQPFERTKFGIEVKTVICFSGSLSKVNPGEMFEHYKQLNLFPK